MFFKESRGDVSLPGSEFFAGQARCNFQGPLLPRTLLPAAHTELLRVEMPYVSLGAAGLARELQRLPQVVAPSLAARRAHTYGI